MTPDQASRWTYRSFINDPTPVEGSPEKLIALLFAEATMIFEKAAQPRTLNGVLDMGSGYFLDLTEAEIAGALRVRPGTVKSRLHDARRLLAGDEDLAMAAGRG